MLVRIIVQPATDNLIIMEEKTSLKKYMNRKKFFASAGTGLFGFILMKTFPFSLFSKTNNGQNNPVKIKINPSAVSRKNR